MLYARNGVAEIAAGAGRRGQPDPHRARHRPAHRGSAARRRRSCVIFVTGIPGAGKTLCGLNAVFGPARQDGAAFLTGNVAAGRGAARGPGARCGRARRVRPARRRHARRAEPRCRTCTASSRIAPSIRRRLPPERLIVFDEAQRAWDAAKARAGTQNKRSRLTMSEPAHTLEIMGRRRRLVGGGRADRQWAGDQHRRGRRWPNGAGHRRRSTLAGRRGAARAARGATRCSGWPEGRRLAGRSTTTST